MWRIITMYTTDNAYKNNTDQVRHALHILSFFNIILLNHKYQIQNKKYIF
jgi:hypothetical protein